jgi:transposase
MGTSFRGLSGFVRQRLRDDPTSGHIFCWLNTRRTHLKALVHNGTGYTLYYRRLSRGTFQMPAVADGAARIQLSAGDLAMLLEGIDLNGAKRRLRHRRHQ